MTTKEYNGSRQVEPEREYSLKEIREGRLIPWALHYQTLHRIIEEDERGENILGVSQEGKGRQLRYTIKGSSIISYINRYARGLMVPAQPKQKNVRKKRTGR